jgi:4-hydroxy-3-polyprenylbenzoate decarboxylase
MAGQDLQSFVQQLESSSAGILQAHHGSQVDPILEITEITDRVTKAGGPALLFENVRGSRFPLVINTFGTRGGCASRSAAEELSTRVAARVQNVIKPEIPTTLMQKLRKLPELAQLGSLPPKIVRRGICQEVVHTDDANLLDLPIIKCWPHDGAAQGLGRRPPRRCRPRDQEPGRYITLGGVSSPSTRKPATATSACTACSSSAPARRDALAHAPRRRAALSRLPRGGERMPVAIALGGPAILPYAATCPLPPGIDDASSPASCRAARSNWSPVSRSPRSRSRPPAEIVIEGYIDPAEPPILEGPFGDHTGFYSLADPFTRCT